VRRNQSSSTLRWLAVALILAALAIAVWQLVLFSRARATFPAGLTIGNVPVGGLDRQAAAQRLLEVYTMPVELRYRDAIIHLDPAVVGFELDLERMLAEADRVRTAQPFWNAFWDYLWARPQQVSNIPLVATYSENRLRDFLVEEIAPRYDQPPAPAKPVVGTVHFQPGEPGTVLDVDRAIPAIERALFSPTQRTVTLTLRQSTPARPPFRVLQTLIEQAIDLDNFNGLAAVYVLDLQSAQEIHLIRQQGQSLSTSPDVAFTAASTIKIPIMVSVFRRLENIPDSETLKLLTDMIDKSGNEPADWLMERVIDPVRGPLEVTADMQAIGLENTFIAGYFKLGAPLLWKYDTPANQRADVNTDPDPYTQTTVTDLGALLEDIYLCARQGGGALVAAFPDEITQSECRMMIDLLSRNRIGVLIEAGVPEGTRVAHKHGWVSDPFGVIHTIGDAGIVYTPGGDYILVVFLYDSKQLVWEPASALVARISMAVYNYFNLPGP